jgi:hypothetical protein
MHPRLHGVMSSSFVGDHALLRHFKVHPLFGSLFSS